MTLNNLIMRLSNILRGGTAQVFIPMIRFLLHSFVSSHFLVLLRYSFWIFSFTCLIVSDSKMSQYLYVFFIPSVLILSYVAVPFHISDAVCYFSLQRWHIFLCQIPSPCPDSIFSLRVFINIIIFIIAVILSICFSFFTRVGGWTFTWVWVTTRLLNFHLFFV